MEPIKCKTGKLKPLKHNGIKSEVIGILAVTILAITVVAINSK